MQVIWQKNTQNNEWFDLLRLDLDAPYFTNPAIKKGVFVIWYTAPSLAKVIKIGSGNLAEQLKNLRTNPSILQYSNIGQLKVAWIAVNGVLQESQMPNVEVFLNKKYSPLIEGLKMGVEELPVNLIGK